MYKLVDGQKVHLSSQCKAPQGQVGTILGFQEQLQLLLYLTMQLLQVVLSLTLHHNINCMNEPQVSMTYKLL